MINRVRTSTLSLLLLGLTGPMLVAAPVPPDKDKATSNALVGEWELTDRTNPPVLDGESSLIKFDGNGAVVMIAKRDGKVIKHQTGTYQVADSTIQIIIEKGAAVGDPPVYRFPIKSLSNNTLSMIWNSGLSTVEYTKKK